MFDYTYGIRSVAEYLLRTKSEVARLERLQDEALPEHRANEVPSAATQAGNTLWQFTDFVFGAADPSAVRVRGKVGGSDLKEFQSRIPAACPALTLCWELANGAKHFHKKPAARVDEVTVSCVAAVSMVGVALPWRRERKKRRAKIVFPDGRRLRAADVFRDAIAEWEALLA